MIDAFETNPNWNRYGPNDETTKSIKRYWTEPAFGGGPITKDLRISDSVGLKTPILNSISNVPTYGFYEITRIKYSIRETNFYYDVQFLAT